MLLFYMDYWQDRTSYAQKYDPTPLTFVFKELNVD